VQIIPHRNELPQTELSDFEQNTISVYAPNPIGRLWFDETRSILNPEAVRYVDRLLLDR
jgi:hypothetical protein